MSNVNLIFTHPQITHKNKRLPLVITTGMDAISWDYDLNIQRYPTYGGEVVQILSCNIANLMIQGTTSSYSSSGDFSNPGIEEIYTWFNAYMQSASQGATRNGTHYDQNSITMSYPYRNWTVEFQCQSAPGFSLGTDIVAPTWQITGKVTNVPESMKNLTLNTVLSGETAKEFGRIHDGVDLSRPDPATNPYQSPFPSKNERVQQQRISHALGNLGSYWQNLVSVWDNGDFSTLVNPAASNTQFLTGTKITKARKK
jgi:hypothetical protein